MKNLRLIIKTFKNQSGGNDCGIACLEMVLRYLNHDINKYPAIGFNPKSEAGLSLLDLKNMATGLGLSSRCVRMEISFLYTIDRPFILHVRNCDNIDHFVVCYGPGKKEFAGHFLVADPATTLSFIPESRLEEIWKSKAALSFEQLPAGVSAIKFSSQKGIFGLKIFPKELAFAISLLGLAIAFLGIAVSWVLQKGLDDSLSSGNSHYITSLLILLLLVTVFKCLLTYLRNRILLTLNTSVNKMLTHRLINNILKSSGQPDWVKNAITKGLLDIRKIQHAVSEMAGVIFTDGVLVFFILVGITWAYPLCGFTNVTYLATVLGITWNRMPYQMLKYSIFEELAIKAELDISNSIKFSATDPMEQYTEYLDQLNCLGKKAGQRHLVYEIIGAVNVLAIMAYGIFMLHRMAISYPAFMTLVLASYFITILLPRICNSLQVIHEGSIISFRKASTYKK